MNHPSCDHFALEELLHDDCNLEQQRDIERHLEHCESCQTKLTFLAAEEELWTQAASHLSTVNEIELPKGLASRLNESTSFVVPALSDGSTMPDPAASASSFSLDTEWTRILDPPTHPEMLGRIDKFEIESKIGQGGMGIVLKGFDRELNRAVAIKVLSPHLAINGTARKRFAREAESAAAVMHPNVVPIYAVNKSPTRPYLVMQLVPGHSLQSLVAENGPLDPKDVVRVSIQIAAGLAAAHKQGLIHRDVKPGNILIERDVSRVMITDFGLARAADDAGMTQTGWLAGTPHYMSPEQSKGDNLDARTDLFSLGSLIYFLATGREPFRGDKPYVVIQKIIDQPATHPVAVNSDVPKPLGEIIEKLLEKDPKDRFQSAAELVNVLEEYLTYLQQPNKSRPPKRILTARQKRRRTWIAAIASTVTLFGVCLFAFSMFFDPIDSSTGEGSANTGGSASVESPVADSGSGADRSATVPVSPTNNDPGPTAFSFFSDDQFSKELADVLDEVNELERSLSANSPAAIGLESRLSPPAGLPIEINRFDSQLDSLESSFRNESRPFAPNDPIPNSVRPDSRPSGAPQRQPNDQSKTTNEPDETLNKRNPK